MNLATFTNIIPKGAKALDDGDLIIAGLEIRGRIVTLDDALLFVPFNPNYDKHNGKQLQIVEEAGVMVAKVVQ